MAFGVFCVGLSFVLMSQVTTLWQFYLVIVLLTVGMAFGTFIVIVSTVGNWFQRNRSKAFAVVMSATALGGLLLPFLQWLINTSGWQDVLLWVGIGFWVVSFPAVFVMRDKPEDYGLRPDGDATQATPQMLRERIHRSNNNYDLRAALKTRVFWQFAIAASLGQLVSSSTLVHVDALRSFGIDKVFAATLVGLIVVGDLLGRSSLTVIGDRFDKRHLLAAAFGVEALGIVALAAVNWSGLGLIPVPVYVFLFGLGFGISIPLRLTLLAEYYGRKSYASIVGMMSTVNALFQAAGAAFPAIMFDLTGDYRIAFLILGSLLVLAIPLSLSMHTPHKMAVEIRAREIKYRSRSS